MKASENKTVDDILRIMKHGDNRLAMQQVVMREFADLIEEAYRREVAARLRNVTVRSDNSEVIAELQRWLKVAEDALEAIFAKVEYEGFISPINKAAAALVAIRGNGCAKWTASERHTKSLHHDWRNAANGNDLSIRPRTSRRPRRPVARDNRRGRESRDRPNRTPPPRGSGRRVRVVREGVQGGVNG